MWDGVDTPTRMIAVPASGRRAFDRAARLLSGGTGPEPVAAIARSCDLSLVGRGTTRLAFDADAHVDGGSAVVKVAIPGRGGRRAVERERRTWDAASEAQRELLAPVVASDPDGRWLVAPRCSTGVPVERAHRFHRRLARAGLVVRDVTPGDVGRLDGETVLVDAAGCQFLEDAPVTVAEMLDLVDRRWAGWE